MSKVDPIYVELAAKLARWKPTDPEYVPQILAKLANLEQAKMLYALPDPDRDASDGRLEVSEKFAKKMNLDKEVANKHMQELYEKGVVFPTSKGPQMARSVLQLHDACLCTPKFDEVLGDEFFKLWEAWGGKMTKPTKEDLPPERAGFRIIPKWKAIKDVPGVLPFDDLREILREQEVIALVPCSDKRVYRDRECDIPEECCVVVSNAARYNLGRGVGRELTYEEALALFDQWDEDPIINNATNQRHINQLMCNCHWCCCPVFKDSAPSRFVATVEPEKCRSCKICVDRCQFVAAEMKYYPEFGKERAYINPDLCRGCGCCVITCPAGARSMKVVRPPEHIPDNVALG